MGNREAVTSSTHSFACSYWLVKKCFWKFVKLHSVITSLFSSSFHCYVPSEIKLNLFRISPVKASEISNHLQWVKTEYSVPYQNKTYLCISLTISFKFPALLCDCRVNKCYTMADNGLIVANSIKVLTQNGECQIDLCFGDITKLKKEDKVDVLVVSAFRGKSWLIKH